MKQRDKGLSPTDAKLLGARELAPIERTVNDVPTERAITDVLTALKQITGAGWASWQTGVMQFFEAPHGGSRFKSFSVHASVVADIASLLPTNKHLLRTLAGAPRDAAVFHPPQNITDTVNSRYIIELERRVTERETMINEQEKLLAERDAKLLQADDVIAELREMVDTPHPGPSTDELRAMGRAEAVELADAMIAAAGFELLRDDGAAMWIQHLKDARPGVQVFFQIPEDVLDSGPAAVFRYVKANVGVAA